MSASAESTSCCAAGTRCRPSSVSVTACVLRWTRRVPKCSSRALTCLEIAGCVSPRSIATAENEPTWPTRRKARSAAIKSTVSAPDGPPPDPQSRDLSKRTGARLERLQPRIDSLEGVVDASSDMWGHQPLHGPLRCQSQTALEEYLGAGVECAWR